jgi:hypothetical protein
MCVRIPHRRSRVELAFTAACINLHFSVHAPAADCHSTHSVAFFIRWLFVAAQLQKELMAARKRARTDADFTPPASTRAAPVPALTAAAAPPAIATATAIAPSAAAPLYSSSLFNSRLLAAERADTACTAAAQPECSPHNNSSTSCSASALQLTASSQQSAVLSN